MGGFGMIMGAALAGAGKGLAEKGELEAKSRYQAMLEGLRSQNQMAETTHTGQINAANREAEQARSYRYDIGRAEAETQGQMRRDKANNSFKATENAENRTQAERMAKLNTTLDVYKQTYGTVLTETLKRSLASGDIQDVKQDDRGNFFAVKKDGSIADLGVTGTPTSQAGLGALGLNLGGGSSPGKPAPAAPANPGLHTTKPAAPAARPAAANLGSPTQPAAWIQDNGEALRFVRNPTNKGKWFIGPDGQTHQVK